MACGMNIKAQRKSLKAQLKDIGTPSAANELASKIELTKQLIATYDNPLNKDHQRLITLNKQRLHALQQLTTASHANAHKKS